MITKPKAEQATLQPTFLPDVPLPADKEQDAAFGHDSIAGNLCRIIQSCPAPFTVGLFGKWGTGKTTVINLLVSKLKASQKPVAVAKVDAWKYEEDSLRRQLLITLDDELGFGLNYKDRLNQTLTEADPTKGPIKYDLGLLLNTVGIITLSFVLAGVILKISLPDFASIVSDLLIQFGLFSFLTQFVLGLFKRVGVTITEHRTDSAEGFERKFKEDILNHAKLKGKRLLIIIDNLDRCSHAKAVELLSTIKTFLAKDEAEQSDCVYLITCDDEAVKQHIRSVYLKENGENVSSAFDADEFLRKFFNAFVRIPTFINTELQSYTEKLLKNTHVLQFDSSDLAYVITRSFRENPRQIKQFINTLLAHFLLAKEREESPQPLMPKETVTGNVTFLAKLLIIRQQFPDIYQSIEEKYLTMDEWQSISLDSRLTQQEKEFRDFLRATGTITTPDIRPFIHLKQSDEELKIPGVKDLELGLIDNKIESVSEQLKSIKSNPSQTASLKKFLPSLIERNQERKQLLLNIVECSLGSLRRNNILMDNDFYNKVGELLSNQAALGDKLQQLEPVLVFEEVMARCNDRYKNLLINQYASLFAPQGGDRMSKRLPVEYATKLLNELILHKDWFQLKLSEIKKAMVDLYSAETKMLALLKDKKDDQRDFLTEESPSKLAESLSDQDVENKESLKEKTSIYINLIDIANPAAANMFLTLAVQLVTNEIPKPFRDTKDNLFSCLAIVLRTYESLIQQISDKSQVTKLADATIQSFKQISDWSQRKIVVASLLILARFESGRTPNIESNIQSFFTNANLESIQYIFASLPQERQQEIIRKYEPALRPRTQQDQGIFDFMYEIAPADTRTVWFNNLIASSFYERALKKLEDLKFKVDDSKAVVEMLLSQAQAAAEPHKKLFYYVVNQMTCADNADLKTQYCAQIKTLVKSGTGAMQETAYTAMQGSTYLSETLRRDVTRDTVEWLRTLNPGNASQPYAIKSVLINWGIIEEAVQKDYIDFIFDKLIKRAPSVDNIRLGYEILVEIKPSYDEYKAYFDDVYAKAEGEANVQIKSELVSGLMKLNSKDKAGSNKDFWDKAEKLSA